MAENNVVKVGELVPDVTVSDERGEQVALRAIEGGYVLYFYPKDMTPGCTSESCDFQASLGKFEDLGYAVYGISPDDAASHLKFKAKHNFSFPLLCDEDHSVAEAFGVWREKKNYGKTYMGIVRSTFVIAPDHTIAAIYDNVRVAGHIKRVLDGIKG
jgi:thioredoxin-dependent peroxiredoxin